MLNEGILLNDSATLMKTEMVRELWRLRETTPDELERAVFERRTGSTREDIDWDVEDNKAGYFLWTKTFDGLLTELVEDGYLTVEKTDEGGSLLKAAEVDPALDMSQFVYPGRN